MGTNEQSLEQRLDHIEQELSTIKSMLSTLLKQNTPDLPQGISSYGARLITIARQNPEAAKAELKRLAKLSRITKRKHREN